MCVPANKLVFTEQKCKAFLAIYTLHHLKLRLRFKTITSHLYKNVHMKVSVKSWEGVKQEKLRELRSDSEAEKESVENNPLLKRVPKSLPSGGLSSRCWRLNFKKVLATHVFPLSHYFVSQFWLRQCGLWQNLIMYIWLVFRSLDSCPNPCLFSYIHIHL